VYEGGVRQVIRRTAAPPVLAWTERTRMAVGGAWGLWTPGDLAQRCFTHQWAHRPSPLEAHVQVAVG
jgi:hypothetical protein